MSFDIHDFARSKHGAERALHVERAAARLRLAERGLVAAENLTGDPHWDSFLQILQGQLDAMKELLAATLEKLTSWQSTPERERLCAEALVLRTQIDLMEKIVQIPKVLREDGERAREFLRLVS